MSMTKTSNIPNILDPAMVEVFLDGAIRVADLSYQNFCRVRPASTKTIEKTSINPPGAYSAHVEGADFSFEAVVEGYSKTYTQAEVALAFQVSSLAWEFQQGKAEMLEFVGQIGASAGRKLNGDGYAILSGGFSDTGPDGVSLFNASHPAVTGGVQTNTGTTALAEASLQAALTQARRLKTPDNLLARSMPTLLVVPPELEYTARELTGSMLSGADMQMNVLATKGLQVLVAPDLSDANDWFLIDPEQFRAYQYVVKGSSPKQWIDMDSDNWRVSDRLVYATGYDGWRGAWGYAVA